MKVLLTGGRSLLGAQVVRALHARGDQVSVLQRHPSQVAAELGLDEYLADLNDRSALAVACAGQEALIHLAARVGVVGTGAQFAQTNVAGTRCVLESARAAGVRRFVFTSSPSVAHSGHALVGEPAGPADPVHAKGHYSRTKAAAELDVLAADAPGFATLAVRPHLVWGPGDTQLVARIVGRARAGRLPLVGGGRALIDTTYLDNAVAALVAALDHAQQAHGRAFVVSNGEPRPVADILGAMCVAAGLPEPQHAIPASLAWAAGGAAEALWAISRRSDDPPMTRFLARQLATAHWFDLRETQRWLGWTPQVTLAEGFARLGAWFATQSPQAPTR